MYKKIVSIFILGAMICSLASCGGMGNAESNVSTDTNSTANVTEMSDNSEKVSETSDNSELPTDGKWYAYPSNEVVTDDGTVVYAVTDCGETLTDFLLKSTELSGKVSGTLSAPTAELLCEDFEDVISRNLSTESYRDEFRNTYPELLDADNNFIFDKDVVKEYCQKKIDELYREKGGELVRGLDYAPKDDPEENDTTLVFKSDAETKSDYYAALLAYADTEYDENSSNALHRLTAFYYTGADSDGAELFTKRDSAYFAAVIHDGTIYISQIWGIGDTTTYYGHDKNYICDAHDLLELCSKH